MGGECVTTVPLWPLINTIIYFTVLKNTEKIIRKRLFLKVYLNIHSKKWNYSTVLIEMKNSDKPMVMLSFVKVKSYI